MPNLDQIAKVRRALIEAEEEIHRPGQSRANGTDLLALIKSAKSILGHLHFEAMADQDS